MSERHISISLLTLSAIVFATSASTQEANRGPADASMRHLRQDHPHTLVRELNPGTKVIVGPMTTGPDPVSAARAWAFRYGAALGIGRSDLEVKDSNVVGGRFTVVRMVQTLDGVPVENGRANLIVRHGVPDTVTSVSSHLRDLGGAKLPRVRMSAKEAASVVRATPPYDRLANWTTPELVVFTGDAHPAPPVLVWKLRGSGTIDGTHSAFTFYVDTSTGELMHVRNILFSHHQTIVGTVTGYATPGLSADLPTNPPTQTAVAGVKVQVQGGGSTYTNSSGGYQLARPHNSQAPSTDLIGETLIVLNEAGSELHVVGAGNQSPVNLVYNSPATEFGTAQTNAFIHTLRAHDFYSSRQPNFAPIHATITARVNRDHVCNGEYDAVTNSIILDRSGQTSIQLPPDIDIDIECENTAMSTVIAHEFGHFVHFGLGIDIPGAFAEGFGDAFAILNYNDPVIAKDIYIDINVPNAQPQSWRNIATANQQFPCAEDLAPHLCGQLLAGVWWDIKEELQATYGASTGLSMAQQLFTDWSQITLGPDYSRIPGAGMYVPEDERNQPAGHRTVLEVLTADDDDGDLCNSTPNASEICDGFVEHGIACPLDDCNGNSVPDVCDIEAQTAGDCNGNAVPDSCEIASELEEDCQPNGIPDSCELEAGLLTSCGGDPNIVDQCEFFPPAFCSCETGQDCEEPDLWCNGVETCNSQGRCVFPGPSCDADELCREAEQLCIAACPASAPCEGTGCQPVVPEECTYTNTGLTECATTLGQHFTCPDGVWIKNCACEAITPGNICANVDQSWECRDNSM